MYGLGLPDDVLKNLLQNGPHVSANWQVVVSGLKPKAQSLKTLWFSLAIKLWSGTSSLPDSPYLCVSVADNQKAAMSKYFPTRPSIRLFLNHTVIVIPLFKIYMAFYLQNELRNRECLMLMIFIKNPITVGNRFEFIRHFQWIPEVHASDGTYSSKPDAIRWNELDDWLQNRVAKAFSWNDRTNRQ
jgi:hypothetical protein